MDTQHKKSPLRTPVPELTRLSFCKPTTRELKVWIQDLPKANIGEMARLLYQALIELNNFKTAADNRIQLMELLRPEVFFVNAQLEKHFLNNSVMMDERSKKVANLCQALQNHLSVGYKLVIADTFTQRSSILALALQRTMHSLFASLVRACQLYYPTPPNLWFELHQVYLLARKHNLHTVAIRDGLLDAIVEQSVEAAYSCALLLSCSRINQMRQSDIAILANVLPSWCHLAAIQNADLASSLFVVNLHSDAPPRYKALMADANGHTLLGFDTQNLAAALVEHQQSPEKNNLKSKITVPDSLPSTLLAQLCSAWGKIAQRDFQRTNSKGTLEICLGMSAVHYYLANQEPFEDTIKNQQSATVEYKTDNSAADIWANALDVETIPENNPLLTNFIEYESTTKVDSATEKSLSNAEKTSLASYPAYTLTIVNHSPGGYCLAINDEVPAQLQAGEIIALRETQDKAWVTAVIRWIRQAGSTTTQIGVELIAPNAQPCGLQLLRSGGQPSHFLRALLVPEIPALSRPASVIAPRIPFQEGHKVSINQYGKELRATLTKRSIHTGSISQFEYRLTSQAQAVNNSTISTSSEPAHSEDFDSLWKSL
ncbi:MAG: molecular chaperone [Pseudomonas sp.]|nr:molecular chaperone [Pseudomonas sp.]